MLRSSSTTQPTRTKRPPLNSRHDVRAGTGYAVGSVIHTYASAETAESDLAHNRQTRRADHRQQADPGTMTSRRPIQSIMGIASDQWRAGRRAKFSRSVFHGRNFS